MTTDRSIDELEKEFNEWAEASDQYEPAHVCEIGDDEPDAKNCIPCNVVKAGRALAEKGRALEAALAEERKRREECERRLVIKEQDVVDNKGLLRQGEISRRAGKESAT